MSWIRKKNANISYIYGKGSKVYKHMLAGMRLVVMVCGNQGLPGLTVEKKKHISSQSEKKKQRIKSVGWNLALFSPSTFRFITSGVSRNVLVDTLNVMTI